MVRSRCVDSSDTIVASGVDPEPGSGNASFEATLPIGDYTIEEMVRSGKIVLSRSVQE